QGLTAWWIRTADAGSLPSGQACGRGAPCGTDGGATAAGAVGPPGQVLVAAATAAEGPAAGAAGSGAPGAGTGWADGGAGDWAAWLAGPASVSPVPSSSPVSMIAMGVPTGTVVPSDTNSSFTTPMWNDSISTTALSVSTSAIASPRCTWSPGCLSQRTRV